MADYRLWGQVQQITPTQYLLLASASPIAGGRAASIVRATENGVDARQELQHILGDLEEQLRNRGDRVIFVGH